MSVWLCSVLLFVASLAADAQSVGDRLAAAWARFEKDSQLRAGIASLYVVDAKGDVVFDRNSGIGLAPASTQKVITAASAYELLGKNFRYVTELGADTAWFRSGEGNLYISGSGDPTLGSWRWKETSPERVIQNLLAKGPHGERITQFKDLVIAELNWSGEIIPPGWIWDDLGQYYGAGAGILNWHENQLDLTFRSGPVVNEKIELADLFPTITDSIAMLARSAAAGTGDQVYLYPANNGRPLTVRGTIPVGQASFKVSASLPDPAGAFAAALCDGMRRRGIRQSGVVRRERIGLPTVAFGQHESPPLDSIVFWFLRKSVNLYGEALIKTIADYKGDPTARQDSGRQVMHAAETTKGAEFVRSYWKTRGIEPVELRLRDGSGLSPENRVTTHAQVQVLQYAKGRSWFPGYYLAFPEYNGMKMKSGTISGVKGFCGYHKSSRDGKEYIFSFLVNNYNGSGAAITQKMYALLNELK